MRGQNVHHTTDQCRLLKDALDVVSKSSNRPNNPPTQNNLRALTSGQQQQTPIIMQLNFASPNESSSSSDQDPASTPDSASQFTNSATFFESSEHYGDSQEEDNNNNYDDDRSQTIDDVSNFLLHPEQKNECTVCHQSFPSRNALHKHLRRQNHQYLPQLDSSKMKAVDEETLIKSDAPVATGNGLAFRGYKYAEMQVRLTPKGHNAWICCDTGCAMTCIDRDFLMKNLPDVKLHTVKRPIGVHGIGDGYDQTEDYATISLYIPGIRDGKRVIGVITREFHVVAKVPCNILLGTDILDPEGFIIDCGRRIATLASCRNMKIPLRLRKDAVPIMQSHAITTKKSVTVPPRTSMAIPIRGVALSDGVDYRFQARYTKDTLPLAMQGHFPEAVFDRNSTAVLYYNTSSAPMKIPKNTAVGDISLWSYNERLTPEDPEVVDCYFGTARIIPTMAWGMNAGLNALQCATPSISPGESIYVAPTSDDLPVTADCYSLLPASAPGHGDPKKFGTDAVHVNTDDRITPQQTQRLRNALYEFPSLWEDRVDRITQPEGEWMEIPIKSDAVFPNKGVYRVSKRDQAVIDEYFDQAVADGRMSMADKITPCG